MRYALSQLRVIGGMRAVEGGAPFARAPLVVQAAADQNLLQVVRYDSPMTLEGTTLTEADWRDLLETNEALKLGRADLPVVLNLALWLLRAGFPQRHAALGSLEAASALAHREDQSGVCVCIVEEWRARPIREKWIRECFDGGKHAARAGSWKESLCFADTAWLLEDPSPAPDRVALYVLALQESGRASEAEDIIAFEQNTHGGSYGRALRDLVADYRREVFTISPQRPGAHTPTQPPPVLFPGFGEEHAERRALAVGGDRPRAQEVDEVVGRRRVGGEREAP